MYLGERFLCLKQIENFRITASNVFHSSLGYHLTLFSPSVTSCVSRLIYLQVNTKRKSLGAKVILTSVGSKTCTTQNLFSLFSNKMFFLQF